MKRSIGILSLAVLLLVGLPRIAGLIGTGLGHTATPGGNLAWLVPPLEPAGDDNDGSH